MKYIFVLSLLFLTSCATPYQESGLAGGYDEVQLSENSYQISFRGNGYTSRQRAEDFALLRAAELTLENGFTHFMIINEASDTSTNLVFNPGSLNVAPSYSTVTKPRANNTILMVNQVPDGQFGFDARITSRSMKQKYNIED